MLYQYWQVSLMINTINKFFELILASKKSDKIFFLLINICYKTKIYSASDFTNHYT